MTVESCPGFHTGAVAAGLKKDGGLDLGLIYSEVPAVAAAVFTRNKVQAAPVVLDRQRIQDGRAQALIVNSGNANCCTGQQGMRNAVTMGALTAAALDLDEELVLVSSTGVIGEQLPVDKIDAVLPALKKELRSDGVMDFARAIMTTDTEPKAVSQRVSTTNGDFHITGVAKGAGMIRPDMATMLCYVMTDVVVPPEMLQKIVVDASDRSFNRISIDGDTSTNDTVLVLANGRSGVPLEDPANRALFQLAISDVMRILAKWLVKDGEGATKVVDIRVKGAHSDIDAFQIADTIAHSNLVKTALFGEDANWGRIIAAAGRAGVPLNPDSIDIYIGATQMVADGMSCGPDAEAAATQVLKQDEFEICVDLNLGTGRAELITCDFSVEYVRINADYRT